MFGIGVRRMMLAMVLLVATVAPATTQAPRTTTRPPLKLEPIAETRLLMEGLNQANFRGLERHLKERPTEVEAWTFIRGQALLIAETGNLLLLRPPKNSGEPLWMERAAEMRDSATLLARLAATRDFERTRTALGGLAESCNRCHQTFRVPTRVAPFAGGPERKVNLPPAHPEQLDKPVARR